LIPRLSIRDGEGRNARRIEAAAHENASGGVGQAIDDGLIQEGAKFVDVFVGMFEVERGLNGKTRVTADL
jgi:hypothetical protein